MKLDVRRILGWSERKDFAHRLIVIESIEPRRSENRGIHVKDDARLIMNLGVCGKTRLGHDREKHASPDARRQKTSRWVSRRLACRRIERLEIPGEQTGQSI